MGSSGDGSDSGSTVGSSGVGSVDMGLSMGSGVADGVAEYLESFSPSGKFFKKRTKKHLLFQKNYYKLPLKKKVFLVADFALLVEFIWYRCYYPHQLTIFLSPICGIFFLLS